MHIAMFTSWQVPCGIADYTAHLTEALRALDDTKVSIVPFDRQAHPRADYVRWGQQMNEADVAHIQHEYAFFGYRLPWRNYFPAFASQIRRPLVITKHVSFDGPLLLAEHGVLGWLRQMKWSLYNRWLGPYATYLNKGMFEVAQQVIVLSVGMKDQLLARGFPSEQVTVIPPGVPTVPSAIGGEHLRAEWGWNEKRIIGVFGFITPAKGHLIALEALAQLPEEYVLLVAGGVRRGSDRPMLEAIQRCIAELNLQHRVRITGYLEPCDVPTHISACHVLAYPYTRVDYSYSVIVGLAYQAAPVIVSDVAAHRELAERSGAVALFRSGDPADLAAQIQALLHNSEQQARLLQKARRFAQENSWSAVARQTQAIYTQAIDGWIKATGG